MVPVPNHNYVKKATNKNFNHFFIFEAVSAEFIKITFAKQLFFVRYAPHASSEVLSIVLMIL